MTLSADRAAVHEPKHWLGRAEKARIHAEEMTDADLKRRMLEVADGYERIAAQLHRHYDDSRPRPRKRATFELELDTRGVAAAGFPPSRSSP